MQLTEDEINKVRGIFHLSEDTDFDVYYRVGSNRDLASIDVHALFEPAIEDIKTTIMNGKLIIAILKSSPEDIYTYVGEDGFLTPGVI